MSNGMAGNKKRSLILAGGGIKVSFQAGVLQVWLDEAGLKFDHVDAASGGVFSLVMMCQGMGGLEIANNWRNLNPRAGISFNPAAFPNLLYAESLFTLDNYRKHVFTSWGLDWNKIRSTNLNATFNVMNFSDKTLEVTVDIIRRRFALKVASWTGTSFSHLLVLGVASLKERVFSDVFGWSAEIESYF